MKDTYSYLKEETVKEDGRLHPESGSHILLSQGRNSTKRRLLRP
jgi:hypothetical protein